MGTVAWGLGRLVKEGKNNYHLGLVREALSALGEGVQRCSKRIDKAHASGCEGYVDAVTDEECDVLETLLGSAFTVCQTHIAQVVADVHRLHRLALKPQVGAVGVQLATTTTKKSDIMRHGCPQILGANVTVIEAMNALANYFKHRDEWPRDWSKATGQTVETVRCITAIGLSQGSSGNLRTGSEVLGNANYCQMSVFVDLLEAWHEHLMTDYGCELRSNSLIR